MLHSHHSRHLICSGFRRAHIFSILSLKSNDDGKVVIRSVMWFSYGASEEIDPVTGSENLIEHYDEVWCRYTHNTLESWKKVKLFKRCIKSETLKANQKYAERISIKAAKYKDLNDLVKRGLLSTELAEFDQNLPQENAAKSRLIMKKYIDDYVE